MGAVTTRLNKTLASEFEAALARSEQLFDLILPGACYERPIPLRHPVIFYEGHLPAFIQNTLFTRTLGEAPFNPAFDQLFERGIDPGDQAQADAVSINDWPALAEVRAYRKRIHTRLFEYLADADFANPPHPLLNHAELLFMLLEHEQMHHETLIYMLHRLPHGLKRKPDGWKRIPDAFVSDAINIGRMIPVAGGPVVMGALSEPGATGDFGWDNEFPQHIVTVGDFEMDATPVTNGCFLDFAEAGGYKRKEFWTTETWQWREQNGIQHPPFWQQRNGTWWLNDLFEDRPLPMGWPVYVTHAEACAYARFAGKSLPTEAEWNRAAGGPAQDRRYPWGNEPPNGAHGNFDFAHWSPVPVGFYPEATTPEGIHDMPGNGWEWTGTPFAPFDGFVASKAYPQYSADFFDGRHYVIKGGSHVTAARMLRCSFRNWYYWHYPYMYATFRCVRR